MNTDVDHQIRDRVAVITLNHPARRNALTEGLSTRLADAVSAAEADENVHAVVITGTPPVFCAGADLSTLAGANTGSEDSLRRVYTGFLAVANCSLPTIAAVGGAAVGAGLNLALAADLRLAGPTARFDARFLRLGLHPGGGMTWMLRRAVGPQTTAAMALFGQVLDAEAAHRAGLVHAVVPGDHQALIDAAVEFAGKAGEAPRELVLATKRTLRTTAGLTEHAAAVETEFTAQVRSLGSPAFAERIAAMRAGVSRQNNR